MCSAMLQPLLGAAALVRAARCGGYRIPSPRRSNNSVRTCGMCTGRPARLQRKGRRDRAASGYSGSLPSRCPSLRRTLACRPCGAPQGARGAYPAGLSDVPAVVAARQFGEPDDSECLQRNATDIPVCAGVQWQARMGREGACLPALE